MDTDFWPPFRFDFRFARHVLFEQSLKENASAQKPRRDEAEDANPGNIRYLIGDYMHSISQRALAPFIIREATAFYLSRLNRARKY